MSLSKRFSEILEGQRESITLRLEMIKLRREQWEAMETKLRRSGADTVADLLRNTIIGYFETEQTAFDYLLTAINSAQAAGSATIGQWEIERSANVTKP